ncbi:hypothetical protein J6590_012215 [Homalodisca vitripennis]|nr:hypothetical protein J6590_012215 [Homalodisca vitripennis]
MTRTRTQWLAAAWGSVGRLGAASRGTPHDSTVVEIVGEHTFIKETVQEAAGNSEKQRGFVSLVFNQQ